MSFSAKTDSVQISCKGSETGIIALKVGKSKPLLHESRLAYCLFTTMTSRQVDDAD